MNGKLQSQHDILVLIIPILPQRLPIPLFDDPLFQLKLHFPVVETYWVVLDFCVQKIMPSRKYASVGSIGWWRVNLSLELWTVCVLLERKKKNEKFTFFDTIPRTIRISRFHGG